ncbi:MAG: hypothetical protein CSA20_04275 [Deltaproteobacteria bacterium]|nr:MAG: hypothetical protein CSB23_02925 [Deltaproteobacteria bacterium]PIE73303.1 MAG: hypothetical protein CSA20_04275 [Deltaproteobacteria bacterium]
MIEALQFEFFRNACIAGLLASVICGVIGTLIVVNRLVFLSGGVAHSAYGGIGLAFFMGWPYMLGATSFAFVSSMVMAAVSIRKKQRADTIIGVMWAVGMATGILLLDLTPGYNVDLMSYLFGSILSVPFSDLLAMGGVTGIILLTILLFYDDLLIMSYDEEFAKVQGVAVSRLYFMLIGLIAITVVVLVQVAGLILVIALLSIPPYIAEKYTRSLLAMMLVSSLLGAVFIFLGLWAAYRFDLTSGASIILVAGCGFFVSFLMDLFIGLRRKRLWLKLHMKDMPEKGLNDPSVSH